MKKIITVLIMSALLSGAGATAQEIEPPENVQDLQNMSEQALQEMSSEKLMENISQAELAEGLSSSQKEVLKGKLRGKSQFTEEDWKVFYRVNGSYGEDSDARSELAMASLLKKPRSGISIDSFLFHRKKIMNQAMGTIVKQRREQGLPVVVQEDSTNPLEEDLQPVVDAFNKPLWRGLEQSLRDLGIDCPDMPREGAETRYGDLPQKILSGETSPEGKLGTVAFILGTDGYEEWRDAYNQ